MPLTASRAVRHRQITDVARQEKRQQNRRRKNTQIEGCQTFLLGQRTCAWLVGVPPLVEKANGQHCGTSKNYSG